MGTDVSLVRLGPGLLSPSTEGTELAAGSRRTGGEAAGGGEMDSGSGGTEGGLAREVAGAGDGFSGSTGLRAGGLGAAGFAVGAAPAVLSRMRSSAIGTSAVVSSAADASNALACAALVSAALASAILLSMSFAMAAADSAGEMVFKVDCDCGAAGLGGAGCAGVGCTDGVDRSGPPHMPQKRLVSAFELPQRGQRKVRLSVTSLRHLGSGMQLC